MKLRNWVKPGVLLLGAFGIGLAIKSFLPQRFDTTEWPTTKQRSDPANTVSLPAIDIEFLRCACVTIPECIAVRGTFSIAPRVISHSAVLIRHPQATFLFDTGLCADIYTYLVSQSLRFRRTLARFTLEQPLRNHLEHLGIGRGDWISRCSRICTGIMSAAYPTLRACRAHQSRRIRCGTVWFL